MKPRYGQLAGTIMLLASLAGCALTPVSIDASTHCPPSPDLTLNTQEMLRYDRCIYSLAPDALAGERKSIEQHFTATGSGADRVKLALLLSVPNSGFRNLSSAQQLLNASEPNGVPNDLRDLAQLLSASLAQQMRLDDQVKDLEKNLSAEKTHSSALQDKIDSVKELERNAILKDVP